MTRQGLFLMRSPPTTSKISGCARCGSFQLSATCLIPISERPYPRSTINGQGNFSSMKGRHRAVSFNGISLHFIRFRGPKKPDAEFKFAPGLNVLWGASDTGKTFLVESIDFMLGAGDALKDIPERQG